MSIYKFIEKFVEDTLKINGKWSLKRVMVAGAFPYTLSIGLKIVADSGVNPYAIQVFQSLLAFIVMVVVTNAYAKKEELKHSTPQSEL